MTRTPLTLSPWIRRTFYHVIIVTQTVGLLNISFDFKVKKFTRHNRFRKIYCAIVHLFYLALLPYALNSSYFRESAYKQRKFYVALNSGISALRLPALLFTLWGIWWHNKELYRIICSFEKLRLTRFHTLSQGERNKILFRNDRLLWLKMLASTSSAVTFFTRIFMFVSNPSWQFIWLSVFYAFLESLTISNVSFFFCGMCYANCAMRYIQAELLGSHRKMNATDLHQLTKMFGDVRKLTNDLTNIFQWQLLANMLATMVSLISLFFSLIIWWCRSDPAVKYPFILFVLIVAFANLGDIYLVAFVCSDTKQCARNIQQLLCQITLQPELSYVNFLQNNLNYFSHKLAVQWVQINICGLFEIDLKLVFDFLQATFVYLTILAQFDLKTF